MIRFSWAHLGEIKESIKEVFLDFCAYIGWIELETFLLGNVNYYIKNHALLKLK